MNARKKLKKMKSENRFLREIIKDHAEMERVYHLWTDGLKVNVVTRYPETLRVVRSYPENVFGNSENLDYIKRSITREFSEKLEKYVAWRTSPTPDPHLKYIEAEIQIIRGEEGGTNENIYMRPE